MPRVSPDVIARRRVANQAAHYADKRARAATPIEAATAAWDHWRGLVTELPAEQAEEWTKVTTSALEARIVQLTRILAPKEDLK